MSSWTRSTLASCLLVLSLSGGPAHGQYYSGYGTGPLELVRFFNRRQPEDLDLDAARAASILAIILYGNIGDDNALVQNVEPFYKYMPPHFATGFTPFVPTAF